MPGPETPALETLIECPPYRIAYLSGSAPDLVIAFASIGHDPSRLPSPEFVRAATAQDRPALFVLDAARSWATAPGFAESLTEAMTKLQARQTIAKTLAIGTSMGAFAALRAGEVLPLTAIVAISPQHRPAAATEQRWRDWTAGLPESLTAPLPQGPRVTLLHGLQDDTAQALGFSQQMGVDHLFFPDQSHASLAPHLKARGVMAGLIGAALAPDRRRLLRILHSAGGQRRAPAR
jgi:hypothetical protein